MLRGTLRLCGAAVTGAVAYWHAVPACEEGKGRTTRVEADILIPGRGPPINNGVVVMKGNKILYAGPRDQAPALGSHSSNTVLKVPCVMPGMWDCHVHFMGLPNNPQGDMMDCFIKTPIEERAARCVIHAQKALDAGFTSVRDVGGMGGYIKTLVNGKEINGPNIYSAFDILSITGGHGDLNQFPSACMDHCHGHGGSLCDGKTECLKSVRAQLRKGADLIKVCASGGVMSAGDSPMHQQFSDEELKTIVDEAARGGRIVAAHCHGTVGIHAALNAGCRTIEHGSYLDEATVDKMVKQNAILVPTRWIIEELVGSIATGGDRPPGLSDEAYEKVNFIYRRHLKSVRLAHQSGVTIAMGTDMFISKAWGRNGEELKYYVNDVGMTELEAIETCTANGPLTLAAGERQAMKSGQLVEGYDADVIALSSSPLDGNIDILGNPDKVILVIKGGDIFKDRVGQEISSFLN
jgi:imidazolonepropionase-like amidohydrolase|eukprot:g1298.t1